MGAFEPSESPHPGKDGPVPGDLGRKGPENPPVQAAEQASPYLYPSEIQPSTAPSRLVTLAAPGRWTTPGSGLRASACSPSLSQRRPASLAPRPRTRHRFRTRSVATPRSHPDCRNVLILIVAVHARVYFVASF